MAIGHDASAHVSTTQQSERAVDYEELFAGLQELVAEEAPTLSGKVDDLKAQVALGRGADDEEVADLIQVIVEEAPGTKMDVLFLFIHPEVSVNAGPVTLYKLKRLG